MADLPIPKPPRDLGDQPASLMVARNELAIEEQQIVLDGKELRLLEIAEEEERLRLDIGQVLTPEAVRLTGVADAIEANGGSTADAKRARLNARKQYLLVRQRELRLLELDDERKGVAIDIAASRDAIDRLMAEASQQRQRLSSEEPPDG